MNFTGFCGGADYVSDSVNAATSELINYYFEKVEDSADQSPFPYSLFPRPGIVARWTGLRGPIRGEFSQDGRVFVVGGDTLYELTGYFTQTALGTVANDDNPVSFSSNGHGGQQLLLISGGQGYIYSLTLNTFQEITDTGFPDNAVMCDFLDGYFLVLQASTSKVYISDSFNGLSWDASNVISVSSSSDELQAIRVIQRVCWMIGSLRTEPWVTTGATSILAPMSNVLLEFGLGAIWSVSECDGALYFIGQTQNGGPQLLQVQGYQVGRVSTHMQERIWAALPDPFNIRTFSYQERGHTFCVVCPNTGPAQAYDLATGVWATWGVWNDGAGAYLPLMQSSHVYGFGMHIVGDRTNGTVYQQSVTAGTDAGVPIRRVRTAPHINSEKQSNFGHEVTIEMEAGLADGSDPAPIMDLLWSKDGGHTWSAPVSASMGVQGQYAKRVKWNRCPGKFEDLVLSAVTSALTPVRLSACYLRVTPGTGMR